MPLSQSSLDPEWPPGTVRIEGEAYPFLRPNEHTKLTPTIDLSQTGDTAEVILQPNPTRDPNDPLVSACNVEQSVIGSINGSAYTRTGHYGAKTSISALYATMS
jgi:hypothetical protein